jgi:hypothetical protein
VILGDARVVGSLIGEKVDVVITSPPYPNRMSYIRELRPYMYWLDFLSEAKDASDLDWEAIGGTWGSATSRLTSWTPNGSVYSSKLLPSILKKISSPTNQNGPLLATYVERYFHDTYAHLKSLSTSLNSSCELHYVVGNSTFYGILLPVEELYAEIFAALNFENITIRPLRKRNSKKELIEFCVSATSPA